MAKFAQPAYWDRRYGEDASAFEWYLGYAELKPVFDRYLRKSGTVLSIGCGTSEVEPALRDDGQDEVVAIDTSPVCAQLMTDRYEDLDRLLYHCMDVSALEFGPETFDAVFEKATLDSMLCAGAGADATATPAAAAAAAPPGATAAPSGDELALRAVAAVHRVLKPTGVFLSVSHAPERSRLALLRSVAWRALAAETVTAADGVEYTVFVMKK